MKVEFLQALGIIDQLKENGYEAYFVGGAVRDLLMDRPIGDVDIATSALPHEVMKLFPRTIAVGVEHGTVIVIHEGTPYEVTTFRTDGEYEDFRRPKSVRFVRSLAEDLKRRDFTMNAIAMNERGELIDPFFGQKAIEEKRIETVGKPEDRFSEDALRMMRAIRFASQLGFQLSADTKKAINDFGELLLNISVERITIEFEKLMQGPFSQEAFHYMLETNLYQYLPGLAAKKAKLEQIISYDWTVLNERAEYWAWLCYLLDLKDELVSFLRLWKLPNQIIKDVQIIDGLLRSVSTKKGWTVEKLYHSGLAYAKSAEKIRSLLSNENHEANLYELEQLYDSLPIKSRKELSVNGNLLMKWCNKPSGPWIAEKLQKIEQAILHGKVKNDESEIKEWLARCNQKLEKNC